jgi:uncharacterized protein YoaH (UPF0181 family)
LKQKQKELQERIKQIEEKGLSSGRFTNISYLEILSSEKKEENNVSR